MPRNTKQTACSNIDFGQKKKKNPKILKNGKNKDKKGLNGWDEGL